MYFSRSYSTKNITNTLLKTVGVLLFCHIITILVMVSVENKTVLKYMSVFYFDEERNFPSTFSALIMILTAYLLWEISKQKKEVINKTSKYWKFLSSVFIFLAIDEYTSIHEHAGHILNLFTDKEFLFRGWYIPVLIIFSGISIFFIKFYFHLPKKTRLQFIFAAAVFITGAVGFELLSAIVLEDLVEGLNKALFLFVFITLEELLEMLGVIIFIKALLEYLVHNFQKIKVKYRIKGKNPTPDNQGCFTKNLMEN